MIFLFKKQKISKNFKWKSTFKVTVSLQCFYTIKHSFLQINLTLNKNRLNHVEFKKPGKKLENLEKIWKNRVAILRVAILTSIL